MAVRCVSAPLLAGWMCKGKDAEPPQGPKLEILLEEERERGRRVGAGRTEAQQGGDVQVAGTGGRTAGGEPGREMLCFCFYFYFFYERAGVGRCSGGTTSPAPPGPKYKAL